MWSLDWKEVVVMTDTLELINRRRRQMHVHSVIYYYLDTSIIDDATFDKWAVELFQLQEKNPELKKQGYKPSLFDNWTGDTGMHLPVTEEMLSLAEWLVDEHEPRTGLYDKRLDVSTRL